MRWTFALLAALLLLRVPSLVQPSGADQALYTYVGSRILQGELPYRDAWDQKPPAIHLIYAGLYALWPHESVVAAADLAAAALVALLLIPLGQRLSGARGAGVAAACLFLLLGDPTFNRLGGVRIRAQCETFIALAATGALLLAVRHVSTRPASGERPGPAVGLFVAGVLAGVAFTLKYNAGTYLAVALLPLLTPAERGRAGWRNAAVVLAGAAVPVVVMLAIFAGGGALDALYRATIEYNLDYSGETYAHPLGLAGYLLTFPVAHARIDALWLVGGLGCIVLLAGWLRTRAGWALLLPVAWVAAACLSIAVNGSRGLPQYFVQAAPALALAAGMGASRLWPATAIAPGLRPAARAAAMLLVAYGAWRVNDFDKIPRNAAHDLAYLTGRISKEAHLARYGAQRDDKYSALAVHRLAEYLRARTAPRDRIYIFGFSPGAYVLADRTSASRFFWSRPILVGFHASSPGYGADGVLADLRAGNPVVIVLQIADWAPPPGDSATFFLNSPVLSPWLHANYRRVTTLEDYDIWEPSPPGTVSLGPPVQREVFDPRFQPVGPQKPLDRGVLLEPVDPLPHPGPRMEPLENQVRGRSR